MLCYRINSNESLLMTYIDPCVHVIAVVYVGHKLASSSLHALFHQELLFKWIEYNTFRQNVMVILAQILHENYSYLMGSQNMCPP